MTFVVSGVRTSEGDGVVASIKDPSSRELVLVRKNLRIAKTPHALLDFVA